MDGERFDTLTRLFGRGLTRRQIISALGVAVAGGLGARGVGLAATCRAPGRTCSADAHCCSGLCGPADWTRRRRCYCQTPADCPAPDQCHDATCIAGICGTTVRVGQPCDDGNACTVQDTCAATGACVGTPVVCTPQDPCHQAVCDRATGQCQQVPLTGTPCDDGNACTQTDTCQNGVCVGSNPVVCTALDQCHDVGTCNPATGVCSNPAKADGSPCDDNNACTNGDTCQSGVCTGGRQTLCTASDQCHDVGTCDPATGICSNPAKPDGSPCNDGDACTQTDTCQGGICTGSNPVVCIASDQCHVAGTCDSATGICTNPNAPDGSACDDGNACTINDVCTNGVCAGTTVICTALDQCHVAGTCDSATGFCSNPNAPDGTACDDGDPCTTGDVCSSGTCTPGTPSTGDLCTTASGNIYGMCLAGDCCIHIPSVIRPVGNGISGTGTAGCTSADQCCQDEETLCDYWAPIATSTTCCHPPGGSCGIAGLNGFTYDCCMVNGSSVDCINGVCTLST